jgi:hypothetical protein
MGVDKFGMTGAAELAVQGVTNANDADSLGVLMLHRVLVAIAHGVGSILNASGLGTA